MTRFLDKDQRRVIDIRTKYAKELVKSKTISVKPPVAPKLIVSTGASTGKSFDINILSQWLE